MWADSMLDLLQTQSSGTGRGLQLAVMTGERSCKTGNLELTAEDLMISESLLSPICSKVSETAPADGGQCSDGSTYLQALKAGDVVLISQLSDSCFVIIAKVVSV